MLEDSRAENFACKTVAFPIRSEFEPRRADVALTAIPNFTAKDWAHLSVDAFATAARSGLDAVAERAAFLGSFLNEDAPLKLQILDDLKILDRIIPCYEKGRGVTQDVRWYGKDVLNKVTLARVQILESVFQTPKRTSTAIRPLCRMAAFYANLSKAEITPVVGKPKGDFVALLFPEHEKHAVALYKKVQSEILRTLGAKAEPFRFNPGEELLVEKLILLSKAGMGLLRMPAEDWRAFTESRNDDPHFEPPYRHRDVKNWREWKDGISTKVEAGVYGLLSQACQRMIRDARVSLAAELGAITDLVHADLRAINPSQHMHCEPEKDWTLTRHVWGCQMARFPRLESLFRELIPHFDRRMNEEILEVPLVGGEDWKTLGIRDGLFIRDALEQLADVVRDERIKNIRTEALRYVCDLAKIEQRKREEQNARLPKEQQKTDLKIKVNEDALPELEKKRWFNPQSHRFHTFKITKRDTHPNYTIVERNIVPYKQFSSLDADVDQKIKTAVESGRYANISDWLVRPDGGTLVDVKMLLLKRGFQSLAMLDEYIELHRTDPRRILNAFATTVARLTITLKGDSPRETREIRLANGFQSETPHTGSGFAHIESVRMDKLVKSFRRKGESDSEVVDRFLKDGIIHVAGTASLEIPSHINPNGHRMIIGKIINTDDEYATLVVDRRGRDEHGLLVTAYYHESSGELRRSLGNIVAKYDRPAENSADGSPQVERQEQFKIIARIQAFLSTHKIDLPKESRLRVIQLELENKIRNASPPLAEAAQPQ